jgi:hypothetical protein
MGFYFDDTRDEKKGKNMKTRQEILTPRKHQTRVGGRPQRRSKVELTRRLFLAMLLLLLLAVNAAAEPSRPILFVHGNGDSAALWHTTIWRFDPGPLRPVRVVLNQEAMTVLTHPLDAGHIVIAEFHY